MQPHHVRDRLLGEDQIRQRVEGLAAAIAADVWPAGGPPLLMIGILRGSFIFLADLVRALHRRGVPVRIDFMVLESYGAGTESSGDVRVRKDFSMDVAGASVVIVDDILDTGRTLAFARRHVLDRGAATVRTCALLDKPSRRVVPFEADHVGFTVPDVFVVGYGLDYDHRYRELPWIAKVTFERGEGGGEAPL